MTKALGLKRSASKHATPVALGKKPSDGCARNECVIGECICETEHYKQALIEASDELDRACKDLDVSWSEMKALANRLRASAGVEK